MDSRQNTQTKMLDGVTWTLRPGDDIWVAEAKK